MKLSMTPSDLLLPYKEFNARLNELGIKDRPIQDPERQWFFAWNLRDFAWSPRDDDERRVERLGHYVGWFNAINWMEKLKQSQLDKPE